MINLRWLVFNTVTVILSLYLIQFYDAFNVLLALDHTFISFLIIAIYASISVYLGIFKENSNFELVKFHANMLPLVGMAGTLTAVMTVIHQAETVGATKLSEFNGLYSIFITTLAGVVFMALVKYQAAFAFKVYDND